MCILVVKKKGVDYPSLEQMKNCCKANPHGFSLSYSYKGRMRTYRTMSERDFLMEFQKIAERYPCEDVAMILHARIATHGTISPHNCHCFQGEGLSFAHNGILPIENRGDLTDSETFFRDYFIPEYRKSHQFTDKVVNIINNVIGSSKFAFLQPNGYIHYFGNFINEDGLLFSNYSYLPRLKYYY